MLFPRRVTEVIADCVEWADKLTRADLISGDVVTENDYTSNFTSALRREINARNIPGLVAKVQLLKPSYERSFGADGCIILSNTNEFKVGLFESKWPRLSTNQDSWDSVQKSSGKSHFDSQLARQHNLLHSAAVWEMFYVEHPFGAQPGYMPNEMSACVWHEEAHAASVLRTNPAEPWTDVELERLLTANPLTIRDVIVEICECRKGRPMQQQNFQNALSDLLLPERAVVVTYENPRERA